MPINYLFWIVWLVCLLLSIFLSWPISRGSAAIIMLFVLVAILGWSVFGPIFRG